MLLTNELSQMRRWLHILQWSVAGVIILMSLLCLWTIRMRRLQNSGRTASTTATRVQSSPPESPVVSPRGEAPATSGRVSDAGPSPSGQTVRYGRQVNVTPTVPQETPCCRASTEAISCCMVPTLFPCISPVWSAVTTQNGLNEPDPHSRNYPELQRLVQSWWAKLQRRQR